ncbi:penicillin-binding transpeptidase domain-containing protein [Garicola koreensis]|uniref:Beta-lactamase n=1 Tax=Garicola koreensis TaxID=1262554 RepID=A0A7W5TR02_9MICC|nr:cell division protein FtsI/penicillin-binding protein 2 [Garicola koreensis]
MRFTRSPLQLITGGLLLLGLVTGCGEEEERAQVDDAAEATAEALSTGDFSAATLASGTQEGLAEAVENLHEPFGELTPEVEVAEIQRDEPGEESVRAPTAEVTFDHSWDLSEAGIEGEAWTYQTAADFTYDEESDVWLLAGETEIILPDYAGHENIQLNTTDAAQRGRIMDDNGRAMVYNRDVVHVGIDKIQLGDGEVPSEETQREAAEQLAEVVGISPEDYAETVLAYGDEAFVEAITLRQDSAEVTAAEVEAVPGAVSHYGQMSLAESSDFAPLLIGRVGPVTAEHLESNPTLSVGEMVGTSGLQAQYQDTLRGTPGVSITMGERTLYSVDSEAGDDVSTHLNPRLQNLAQDIVGDQETTAAMVAIRPSDGGILAAASHTPDENFVDVATESAYAPGSTFKVVSALAMLRNGLTPQSQVSCPGSTTVHGQQFSNVEGYSGEYLGDISFQEAMAASCNTLFVSAWDDVSSQEVHQAALDLGIDNSTGIGLPAYFGSIPDDSELNLHAANLFGQGVVETSTLGMAAMTASIGAGETLHPRLVVADQETADGEDDGAAEGSSDGDSAGGLTGEEAEQLRELMRGTVDFGTLSSMDPVPGDHVYAKTGTAEVGEGDDSYAHTWVAALQGDLAVAVFMEEGEFGGSTNGPLLHEFLTEAGEILD